MGLRGEGGEVDQEPGGSQLRVMSRFPSGPRRLRVRRPLGGW